MIKKKLKLFYKEARKLFFKIYYGNILTAKKNVDFIKKIKIENKIFKPFSKKQYQIYIVKNARIYTDNNENVAIIKNNLILPHISFQQINGKLNNYTFNSVLSHGTPAILRKIKGTIFNLCQGGSGNNYFHFMFDIVPKIYLLSSKINLNTIDYFYINEPKTWQINILKKLGIKKSKLLNSKKNNHVSSNKIYAVDHPWYTKGYIQNNLKTIPSWIINKNRNTFLKKNKTQIKNRIFLDRSKSQYNHCQIANPKLINKFIKKNNFKSLKPELLKFQKQIDLFNDSSIIIGAHGASFTNIIFCKPGTKIIEIIPKDHPNRKCERISKILNLKYYRIETKIDNADPNYPFRINIEKRHLNLINKIINL